MTNKKRPWWLPLAFIAVVIVLVVQKLLPETVSIYVAAGMVALALVLD